MFEAARNEAGPLGFGVVDHEAERGLACASFLVAP
jgi:hypothetical protein